MTDDRAYVDLNEKLREYRFSKLKFTEIDVGI